MVLKGSGYSFLTDEKETFDYLADNMPEIIKDFQKEFGEQVSKGKVYSGFRARIFRAHMFETLRQRIRALYSETLHYHSEQAMIVQEDPNVSSTIEYIISKVMEEK